MLSIRTQDRMALVPYNEEVYLKECPESKKCFIRIVSVKKNTLNLPFTTLGTYATKERALEVLDEIQDYVRGYEYVEVSDGMDLWDVKKETCNLYRMPKEWGYE